MYIVNAFLFISNDHIYHRWKGIGDDLTLLLEEDLSAVNLCTLHCEIRNTEQIISSLGLFAYKIGSLGELNAKLSELGPRTMKRIIKNCENGGTQA